MNKRQLLRFSASAAMLGAFFGAGMLGCSEQKPTFHSIDLTGAQYANHFELTDHLGKKRQLTDFAGKVVVVFFGYTQCPDVCPTAMAELAQVKVRLGKDGDKLQGIFITVDPERDTPEVLKAYMENFDPAFLALYTTPEKLMALTKDFKVYFKKVDGKTASSYTIDHSAGSYVYDPQGRLRLFTRHASGVEALTADVATLLTSR
jgi:protein SCO1/2